MAKRGREPVDSLSEARDFIEDAAAKIHGLKEESGMRSTLRDEFRRSEKLGVFVLLPAVDGSKLTIAETTLSSPQAKKEGRLRLKGRKIDLSRSRLLSRVVRDGETLATNFSKAVSEFFPPSAAERLAKNMSLRARIILTPLRLKSGLSGVLAVSHVGPSRELVRSVERLARHLAAALELAREHRDRERIEEELRGSREQLRNLSSHLQSAREEERTQIAREMHDELGQTLTALKIDLSSLKAELSEGGKDLLKRLDSSLGLTDRTIQTVKRISGELRPRLLDTLGLVAAMQWQGKDFEKRTRVACLVTTEPEEIVLDNELSTAVFRIFQEALTNVARHAEATRVEVSLKQRGGRLELVIKDNGKGITRDRIEQSKSLGLVGMRERARYWGGEFRIEGGKRKGTTVVVTIPTEDIAEPRLVATSRLVGREKEMRKLKGSLKGRSRGEGKLILIHGEAGVGKTRLVSEFGQDLETRGGRVLLGRCREDTRSVAYYPFREALSRFLEVRKEEGFSVFEGLPGYSRWELARIVPAFRSAEPQGFEPAKDPFRLYGAFRLFIESVAGRSSGPLLFTIEDLHLSDEVSLDLLRYLARNVVLPGVQLCATYRTEEAGENLQRFTDSLRKEELSQVIHLKPLSSRDVSEMIDLFYPNRDASPQFKDLLYEKTQGNPFFVSEVVKLVPGEKVASDMTEIGDIPRSIQAVLRRRVEVLEAGAREILSCAAVVGEEFEFEVLRGAVGRPEMEVMEAIEVGARAHIVRESTRGEEERYRFVHALMADTLYSGIGKTRRRLWHSQVGEALERVYAERLEELNGQLTHHFELGQNWEKAFAHAIRSAEQAKKVYANQEAVKLYKKARELLPRVTGETDEESTIIARGLGAVYMVTGKYEKAFEEYRFLQDLARSKGDQKEEGEALRRMAEVYHEQGKYDDGMVCAEKSCEVLRNGKHREELAKALGYIGHIHMHRGEHDKALDFLERSSSILREIGDEQGVAGNLNIIGIIHMEVGDYQEALELYARCLKTLGEKGRNRLTGLVLHNIALIHSYRGDFDGALTKHEQARKIWIETGDRQGLARTLTCIGEVHRQRGESEKALKWQGQALKIYKEIDNREGQAIALGNIGIIHGQRMDVDESLAHLEKALTIFRETGSKKLMAATLLNLGVRYYERFDYSRALEYYEEALALQREIGDRRGSAAALYNIGIIHSDRGNLGEALNHIEKSLKMNREMDLKKSVGWSVLGMGNLLRWLQDPGRALECHAESLKLMEETGIKTMVPHLLAQIGIDHHLIGDDEKALRYLNEATQKCAGSDVEPQAFFGLSQVWLSKGNPSRASESCEVLLKTAEARHLKAHLAAARRLKGEILLLKANSESDAPNEKARVKMLKDAESELKEAARIAEDIDAQRLLWQIYASLARVFRKRGKGKKASEHFLKAREIIKKIASSIGDEKLTRTFLDSKQVRSVLESQ